MSNGNSVLRVEGIVKKFGGLVALDNVSFEVGKNEFLGIIGPNGAGKTTLFNVITGFLKPEQGRVIFNGTDITKWPVYKRARIGIARTFQIMKPLENLTVMDNVVISALPRSESLREAKEKAEETLDLVKLLDKKDLTAKNLNASEKRRLEIARALVGKPMLLLLDEALAGQSPSEIDETLTLLRNIHASGKITIIMIEHVMRAIMRIAERIIVLNYGKIIAVGTPREVSENPSVVEAYLGSSRVEVSTR